MESKADEAVATKATTGISFVRLACFQVRAAFAEIDSGTLHPWFVCVRL